MLLTLLFAMLTACTVLSVQQKRAAVLSATLALHYMQQGLWLRGQQKLLHAQQLNANETLVWSAWGYFYQHRLQFLQAMHAYQRAIQLNPMDASVRNNYAVLLCQQGDYHQAIKQFLLAANMPHYLQVAKAYRNAAICAHAAGNVVDARRYRKLAAQFSAP